MKPSQLLNALIRYYIATLVTLGFLLAAPSAQAASLSGESVTLSIRYQVSPGAPSPTTPIDHLIHTQTFTVGAGVEVSQAFTFTYQSGGFSQTFSGTVTADVSGNGMIVGFSGTEQPGGLVYTLTSVIDQSAVSITSATQTAFTENASFGNAGTAPTLSNTGTGSINCGFFLAGFQPGQTMSQTIAFVLADAGGAPEIAVEQPTGINIADGGTKDMGTTDVGSSTRLSFRVKNTGTANLTGLTFNTNGGSNPGDFVITNNLNSPIAGPAGSDTFVVTFTPSAAGARSCTIQLVSNDADENPFDITLTGTGVALTGPVGANLQAGAATAGSFDWPFNSLTRHPTTDEVYGFWRKDSGTTALYSLIKWTGSAWTTVGTFAPANVIANFQAADFTSLAIDSTGKFHVAISGSIGGGINSTRGVWYGTSTTGATGTWTFTQVETYSDPNGWKNTSHPVIKVDTNNRPHIAFDFDDVNGTRSYSSRYRWFDGSVWQGAGAAGDVHVQAGNASNEVNDVNFALDSNNKAHFVMQAETNGSGLDASLIYINNVSGSFSAPVTIAAGATNQAQGTNPNILLDAANKVHVVASNYLGHLTYYTNASGSFVTTRINGNATGVLGTECFSRNSAGDLFVVYYAGTAFVGPLHYARLPGGTGSIWTIGQMFPMPVSPADGVNYFSGILNNAGLGVALFDYSPTPGAPPRNLQSASVLFATAPTVTTAAQSAVTATSATLGGNVTADGGAAVTERGIVWKTSTGPTTADNKVQIGSGTGSFSSTVGSLPSGTTVFVRAYAINSVNTSYGSEISFVPLPNLSINDVTASEGNSGTTNFAFTVSLSAPAPAAGVTFDIATANGTATTADSDFVAKTLTSQTIPAGSSSYTFTVLVNGEVLNEVNETFFVNVTNVTGATVTDGQGLGTINNDDSATVTIAKITDGAEANTPTNGKFRVTQTAASSTATTLTYSVGGTATSGSDYIALTGSVTIPANQTTADIDVTVLNDGTVLEPTETVIVTLTAVTAGNSGITLGTTVDATMNLTDDDTATVTIAKITDGNENGPVNGVFRVTQTAASSTATTLTYSVGGTATSGSDYTTLTGSVTIPANQTTADITVAISDDALLEASETISLTLTGFTASDADVSLGTTVSNSATITDNDTATASLAVTTQGNEAGTVSIVYTVTLSKANNTDATITFDVADAGTGTATSGSDYTAIPGGTKISVSNAGSTGTYTMLVADEALVEATETVVAQISNSSNAAVTIGTATATANITDNDTATVTLAKITDGIEAASPTNALFRVTQTAQSSTDTVITYTVGGTATSGTDFNALSGAVTILAGNTTADINVAVLNENVVEATETVSLTLTGFSSGDSEISLLAPLTASATITDSDTTTITLTAVNADQNEGTGGTTTAFTFSATLSNPVQGGFTIAYSTADGTAQAGSDYNGDVSKEVFSGSANESKIITVLVTHDGTNEIDEAFTVALGAITATTLGGSISIADSPQTGTIRNDDALTISIAATDANADENTAATGTYRVTRNSVLGNTTVNLAIDASSTAADTDWTQSGATLSSLAPNSTGTVTIPDGSTFVDITLTPTTDLHAEAAETVRLNITSDAAYVTGSPDNATVTIGQNDFLVINTNDSGEGSLRQAVLNANAIAGNDTITFDATVFTTPQTITLTTGQLVLSSNVNVQGVGAALLIINGNAASRIFHINNNAVASISDLTATNGKHTTSWGGAVNVVNGSNVTLLRCVVSNSTSQLNGGGIYVSGSTLNAISSTISGNTATTIGGGALSTGTAPSGEIINLINSTISGNTSVSGGAMHFGTNPNVSIRQTTITNNTTTTSGGSVTVSSGTVTVSNSLIAANVNNTSVPDVSGTFTSNGGNVIGNVGTATGFTGTNDLIGTGAAPINPLIAALSDNGGPTLTHLPLNGSPAINNGLVANLPTDTYDLDVDTITAESLPVDQRGGVNLRQRGSAPDAGAVEAFAFEPTLTAANTDEDNLNSSGLVITANTADGGLTTHYKITEILNGTLYQNDGVTAILAGDFITKNQGAAGLKFLPAANLHDGNTTIFGFAAQAAVGTNNADLRGTAQSTFVTVNSINDEPTVVDGGLEDETMTIGANRSVPLSPHFTDLDGDTLTFTIQSNSNSSIAKTSVLGNNLKLSALDNGVTTITVQASDGLGGTVTDSLTVFVGTNTATAKQPFKHKIKVNNGNGLFEVSIQITNTTPQPLNGFRLHVDFDSYRKKFPSLRLENADSPSKKKNVYVDYRKTIAVDGNAVIKLQFYTKDRKFPVVFKPIYTMTPLKPIAKATGLIASLATTSPKDAAKWLAGGSRPLASQINSPQAFLLPDGSVQTQFPVIKGRWYRVSYSTDQTHWINCPKLVQATSHNLYWTDSGPPNTATHPAGEAIRFYRLHEITAP